LKLADLVLLVCNLGTAIDKFMMMVSNFKTMVIYNSVLVLHTLCVVQAGLVLVVGNLDVVLADLIVHLGVVVGDFTKNSAQFTTRMLADLVLMVGNLGTCWIVKSSQQ
jgi:hypothetical protein